MDTGSATTLVNADVAAQVGIVPEPTDRLRTLRGVGGRELVFTRKVEAFGVGTVSMAGFDIEIGGMDYGFDIQGIIGMDFLSSTAAIVDLDAMALRFA